ncbi:MAG: nucleotide exchange factor GrpE [Thermodesulfobacteriota bacterium]
MVEDNPDNNKPDEDFEIGIQIDGDLEDLPAENRAEKDAGAALENAGPESENNGAGTQGDPSIHSEISALRQQLQKLASEFERKLKYDAHKNKIIDNLHDELQEFRDGVIKKHLHSMVMDLIKIIDDIRKYRAHYAEQDTETSPAQTAQNLLDFMEDIASDLEDLFAWQGVSPFRCGDKRFDNSRQRIVKKIATDDPEKDKLVAASIRPGYTWEDKIIRPEMIAVYVYNDEPTGKDQSS